MLFHLATTGMRMGFPHLASACPTDCMMYFDYTVLTTRLDTRDQTDDLLRAAAPCSAALARGLRQPCWPRCAAGPAVEIPSRPVRQVARAAPRRCPETGSTAPSWRRPLAR